MQNEKTVDSLGRRLRYSSPVDDGKRLVPAEADFLMFEWLDDHGPLPTPYLYEATKHLRQNYTGHQKRLGKLFHRANTPDGGRYIVRPAQQRASYRADRQDATHDNSKYARYALQNRGIALFPDRFDPMHHRFMNACVTASVRLAAIDAGLEFVTFKTILGRHTCPQKTREQKNPLAIPTAHGTLIPDDLTGLSYPTEPKRTYRFIAWEQDRATETLDAIELKIACYLDMLRKRSYEGHWGVPNLFVAIVTTRLQRMRNIMELLERLTVKEPEFREFFLFKFRPEFADEWVTPPIMKDLLSDPWERAKLGPLPLDRP